MAQPLRYSGSLASLIGLMMMAVAIILALLLITDILIKDRMLLATIAILFAVAGVALVIHQARSSANDRSLADSPDVDRDSWSRKLLETAPVPLVISRQSDGVILYANDFIRSFFGMDPADLIGKRAPDFYDNPDDRAKLIDALTKSGRVANFEMAGRRPDGTVIWLSLNVQTIEFEGEAALYTAFFDCTTRKQAEQAQQKSEERLELAMEGSLGGVWDARLDPERSFQEQDDVYFSPRCKGFIGFADDEFPHSAHAWIERIHPQDIEMLWRTVEQHAAGQTPFHEIRYRIRHRDESWRWIHSRGRVTRDNSGRPVRWTGIIWDITDRLEAEEAARLHQANLAHVGRISTAGELAAALAHELNQPLSTISNFAGASRIVGERNNIPAPLMRNIDGILDATNRAKELIDRFRSFLRRSEACRQAVNLVDLCAEIQPLVQLEADHRGCAFELRVADGLRPVLIDSIEIQQVVLNLAMNGLEMMNCTDTDRLTIEVSNHADGVAITVTDTGPGVDPAVADCIFQPFFTTKQSGMGLGLSISRTIIRNHGGTLEYNPAHRSGASFVCTLPAFQDEKAIFK